MAQREEETELKVPDGVTVCANNCGRPGSPATNNMCPGCFQAALSLNSASCSARDKRRSSPIRPHAASGAAPGAVRAEATDGVAAETESAAACPASAAPGARAVNRCTCCRRRVGLTGFRCRCGELFCAQHRYSDRHECSFDYKAAGREAIERENPVVKAAKHVRI